MGFSGKVVFTSGRSTDLDIRLLDISSGRLAQLTHGSYLNDHATWSAGGKQVAFVSMLEDAIPLLSGTPSRPCSLVHPTLSKPPCSLVHLCPLVHRTLSKPPKAPQCNNINQE